MPEPLHRHTIRLPDFDYTQPGAYFITIVTFQRQNLFGEIHNEQMKLNNLGLVIQREWERLPARFPRIQLDEFSVMPNHLHGIILMGETRHIEKIALIDTHHSNLVSTIESFGKPIPGSIPTIIRSFKSATTYRINLLKRNNFPLWQRNYYEHVIRDEIDWNNIRLYIQENPAQWNKDPDKS